MTENVFHPILVAMENVFCVFYLKHPEGGERLASIKDVARQAGVAISTVSKVLNGYTGVSEKTKERVNEVIEELNFTPNAMAAALSSRKSGRVALLLNLEEGRAAVDEIDLQYLAGAIHRARELKMDVVTLFFSMLEDKGLEEVVNYLKAQGIEGIILYGMERDDPFWEALVECSAFWTVVVDAPFSGRKTSSVWIDQAKAQYDVAKKTIEENENCRRVLYIAGKEKSYVTAERIKGMRQLAGTPSVTDEEIDNAYGAFHLGIPVAKLRQIDRLRQRGIRTYVLSNNNPAAMGHIRRMFKADGKSMEDYFDKIYLSYEMRELKPSEAIFRKMIADSGMVPERTLFIDDGQKNVDTAQTLGFAVYKPAPGEDFGHLLDSVGRP